MMFDELDLKMRVFETSADFCVLPEMFMVARLDGRSFTRLTKEVRQFEAPFDEQFRDLIVQTAESSMNCGFRILYAYTQSDEMSLLFDPEERLLDGNFVSTTRLWPVRRVQSSRYSLAM